MNYLCIFILALSFVGCQQNNKNTSETPLNGPILELRYDNDTFYFGNFYVGMTKSAYDSVINYEEKKNLDSPKTTGLNEAATSWKLRTRNGKILSFVPGLEINSELKFYTMFFTSHTNKTSKKRQNYKIETIEILKKELNDITGTFPKIDNHTCIWRLPKYEIICDDDNEMVSLSVYHR